MIVIKKKEEDNNWDNFVLLKENHSDVYEEWKQLLHFFTRGSPQFVTGLFGETKVLLNSNSNFGEIDFEERFRNAKFSEKFLRCDNHLKFKDIFDDMMTKAIFKVPIEVNEKIDNELFKNCGLCDNFSGMTNKIAFNMCGLYVKMIDEEYGIGITTYYGEIYIQVNGNNYRMFTFPSYLNYSCLNYSELLERLMFESIFLLLSQCSTRKYEEVLPFLFNTKFKGKKITKPFRTEFVKLNRKNALIKETSDKFTHLSNGAAIKYPRQSHGADRTHKDHSIFLHFQDKAEKETGAITQGDVNIEIQKTNKPFSKNNTYNVLVFVSLFYAKEMSEFLNEKNSNFKNDTEEWVVLKGIEKFFDYSVPKNLDVVFLNGGMIRKFLCETNYYLLMWIVNGNEKGKRIFEKLLVDYNELKMISHLYKIETKTIVFKWEDGKEVISKLKTIKSGDLYERMFKELQ